MAANQPPVALELQRDNLDRFELESWSLRSYGLSLIGRDGYHGDIRVLAPDLVKVDILPEGEEAFNTPGVLKTDWDTPEFDIEESDDNILISTSSLVISVQIEPFGINLYDTDMNLISGSHPNGMGYERFPFQDWTRSVVPFGSQEKNDSQEMVDIRRLRPFVFRESDDTEHIYGLGMHASPQDLKPIDSVGQWNSDAYGYQFEPEAYLYASNPFHIGLKDIETDDGIEHKAYAMYLDNTYRVEHRLGREQNDDSSYHFFSYGGNLSLYIMFGPEIPTIVERFTELTGRIELPPVWALGLQQSHWTYPSSEVILEVARRYREAEIPLDAMHTDIDYFGPGFRVFTFNESYKNPEIWAAELEEMGVKWVAIVNPGINSEEPLYFVAEEAFERDVLVRTGLGEVYEARVWPDEAVWTDYALEEGREWWAGQFGFMFEAGLDGIWQDMTEPAVFPPTSPENMADFYHTMPMDNVHANIYGEPGPIFHREFHNLYGNFTAISHNRAFEMFLPNTRKFILTRNAFTGIQRYATVWTGDSTSNWEGFRGTFGIHQNMGLSGWTLMGTDFGGFVALPSAELMARWIQGGFAAPYVRDHYDDIEKSVPTPPGPEFPGQEMYNFPEWVQEVARQYIGLRYRLLPYLYSEVYKASQTGWLIQQPLTFQFQDDPDTHKITYQYMFGECIMVAPVVQQGERFKYVYFPSGTQWVDWYTDEIIDGGQRMLVDAPRDFLPLYVKRNCIIPSRELQQYTGQRPLRNLQLDVYLGADSADRAEYEFYLDDQNTFDYRDGEFDLTGFVADRTRRGNIIFTREEIEDGFDDPIERYTLVFHHVMRRPRRVQVSSSPSADITEVDSLDCLEDNTFFYDSCANLLYVQVGRDFEEVFVRV
ncbi:glycoside hydrolase family 31 protein [Priestia flexa]|uniref:glycoside hydrolase family 31 protein n=1 Tax=Priestia flexa TaxID=86664 RepID=UPI000CBE37D6|nr:glycoside hydrolase family 31 protein [Priestia flexa]MEC0664467.1 glycoside hydrolase family 31 protein [Priestia flexa]